MKKFLFLLMAGTMLCTGAYAKHNCGCEDCHCKVENKMKRKGGFVAQAAEPMSIDEVRKLESGSYVTLKGRIESQTGDEEYTFSDGANYIPVEIKDKVWQGEKITPKDEIIIYGKTDDGANGVVIDVKSLKRAKP